MKYLTALLLSLGLTLSATAQSPKQELENIRIKQEKLRAEMEKLEAEAQKLKDGLTSRIEAQPEKPKQPMLIKQADPKKPEIKKDGEKKPEVKKPDVPMSPPMFGSGGPGPMRMGGPWMGGPWMGGAGFGPPVFAGMRGIGPDDLRALMEVLNQASRSNQPYSKRARELAEKFQAMVPEALKPMGRPGEPGRPGESDKPKSRPSMEERLERLERMIEEMRGPRGGQPGEGGRGPGGPGGAGGRGGFGPRGR